jgi:Polyketide cyclase / dehydrase and lipid transport
MTETSGEVVFERPVEEVFNFVADERNVYDPRIVRAEKLTDGPVGKGTRFRSEMKRAGRITELIVELTAFERPRRLASTTYAPSITIHTTRVFEAVPEGTRMRWLSRLEPHGFLRVLAPILGVIAGRQERKINDRLKHALETSTR